MKKFHLSIILVISGLIFFCISWGYAADLLYVSDSVSNRITGNTPTIHAISFKTATSDTIAKIEMQFSPGFNLSAVTLGQVSGIGAGTISVSGDTVVYTVTTPNTIPSGIVINITLQNIGNASQIANAYTVIVTTKDSQVGAIIDGPTPTPSFILSDHSTFNPASSYITFFPYYIKADGTSTCTAVVTINDLSGYPLSNKLVSLYIARGAQDAITTITNITDSNGKCTFTIQSSYAGLDTISAVVSGYPNDTITRGVNKYGAVGIWNFDTNTLDYSGCGNNGTPTNGPVFVAGKYGSALQFDGVDDWVSVLDSSILRCADAVTVEAWVKPDASSGYHMIACKGSYTYFFCVYSGVVRLLIGKTDRSGWNVIVVGTTALSSANWYHLVGTYEKGVGRVFINGVQDGVAAGLDQPLSSSCTASISIGSAMSYANAYWYNGVIDEVKIYDRALTEDEIKASYEDRANIYFTATNLKFVSSPFSVLQNQSSPKITVIAGDNYGNTDTTFNNTVSISSSSSNGKFSSDGVNWSITNDTYINISSGIGNFYYKDSTPGTPTITVSRAGLSSDTQTVNVVYGAIKFKIVTPPRTVRAGSTSESIVVQAWADTNAKDIGYNGPVTYTSSSATGRFSTDGINWTGLPTIDVSIVQGETFVYYKDTDLGTPTITVSGSLISDTQIETIIVSRLKITTPPRATRAGWPTDYITVEAQDENAHVDYSYSGTITLSTSSSTGFFSINNTNWKDTTVLTLIGGSVTFYYKDNFTGSPVITVSCAGLISDTQTQSIIYGAIKLKIITPMRTVQQGNTSKSICVQAQTNTGTKDITYNGTMTYTSSSSTGKFSSDMSNWSAGNTFAAKVVSGDIYVYSRDTTYGTWVITVSATDLLSDTQFQSIILGDITSPCSCSITINNGATYANTFAVTLTLSASDTQSSVDTMVISNYSNFSGAGTYPYSVSRSWILDGGGGEGTKTVYVKFIDSAGNISSVVSDAVNVDLYPPSWGCSIVIDSGAVSTFNNTVLLTLSASDSWTTVDTMAISNYSDFSISNTYSYANTQSWTLSSGSGIKTVYVKFMDSAKNVSIAYSDTILLLNMVISGIVTKPDSVPITGVIMDVLKDGNVIKSTTTFTDGTYQLSDLDSGTYILRASWTLNEITSNVSITTTTGTTDNSFTLSVTCQLSQLSGMVAQVKPKSTSFSFGHKTMTAESDGFVQLTQKGRVLIRVPTDAGGNYSIPHLLPGRYTAKAFNGYIYSEPIEITLKEGQFSIFNFTFASLPEDQVYTYPNPTKVGSLTFHLYCGYSSSELTIRVYNIAGELVKEISDSEINRTAAPIYEYIWDCKNTQSQNVASGVYIYQVIAKDKSTAEQKQVIKKLAIIK